VVRVFYATLYIDHDRQFLQFMFQGEHHRIYRTDLAEALGVQAYEERVHERAHPKAVPPRRPLMSGVNPTDEQIRVCFREPESTIPGFQRHPLLLTPAACVVHRALRRTLLPRSGYAEALTAPQQWLLSFIFHQTPFDIVDLLLCEMEDIIFDGVRVRRQLAYGHFICHILPALFPRHRLQPVASLPEMYSYYRPPRATDRRLGQRAFQAVQQRMGPEAAAQAAVEDEALAAYEPTGLHDLEEVSSDESDDKTYAPPSPRAHDAEAGGSQ